MNRAMKKAFHVVLVVSFVVGMGAVAAADKPTS